MATGPAKIPEKRPPAGVAVPRDEKGRVLPGYSLNPGGRTKGLRARVCELLEKEDPETGTPGDLWAWYDAVRRGKIDGFGSRERMEAAKRLEERAYGKAPETHVNVNADAETIEGAAEVASEALADLASVLASSPDPDPPTSGGSEGGSSNVTPLAA